MLAAPKGLKWGYAIVVLSLVLPMGLASGWMALGAGKSAMGLAAIPFAGPLLMMALGIYRLVTVFKNPLALGSYDVGGFAKFLRKAGVGLIWFGALMALLMLAAWPLMYFTGLAKDGREGGVGLFVVAMYLSMLGSAGVMGLIMFEFSRLIGMEKKFRERSELSV